MTTKTFLQTLLLLMIGAAFAGCRANEPKDTPTPTSEVQPTSSETEVALLPTEEPVDAPATAPLPAAAIAMTMEAPETAPAHFQEKPGIGSISAIQRSGP